MNKQLNKENGLGLVTALGLLLLFGVAMGGLIVLSRRVIEAGISGLTVAAIQNLIAGSLLVLGSIVLRQRVRGGWVLVAYLLLSAILGIALPHWLVFTAAPKIGVSLASTLYLFAPVMTYAIALSVKHDSWNNSRVVGMMMGFLGGLLIVYGAWGSSVVTGLSWKWVLVGLLAPFSMAVGNVFRSHFWPDSLPIMALSGVTLLIAGGILAPLSAFDWPTTEALLSQADRLFAMAMIAAVGYLAFFSLQFSAGAVYVSQSGYVITAVGIAGGIWLYSEDLNWQIWAGIATLCLGVGMTTHHLLRR